MRKEQLGQLLAFILQSIVAGLAIAFLLIVLFPTIRSGLISPQKAVVSPGNAAEDPVSYSDAVSGAAPAVVNVYATTLRQQKQHPLFQDPLFRRFFGNPRSEPRRDNSLGSGVIIDSQGYILTNAHVVKGADEIIITLTDGRQTFAGIVGTDEETDLTVLQIKLDKLPSLAIGDSTQLNVGDVVLAIGNPYDIGQTVTQGIVSATGRKRLGITTFEDFIQTDADINPGNSGGALITARGKLVGINTEIISSSGGSQGIGLAIPIHLAVNVMQQLIERGHVVRGWLGVSAQPVPMDMAEAAGLKQGGVLISATEQGGPADAAGIMPGDILLEIDNQQLAGPQQAINLISQLQPGSPINIRLLNGWKEKTVVATISQRPPFKRN